MNKITTSIALVFCLAVSSYAQEEKPKVIVNKVELVAGTSFSNNSGYLSKYDSKVGYAFGVGYYQKINNTISLNLRSLYEMKGSSSQYSYNLSDINGTHELTDKFTIQFNYLSFYMLPTVHLGRNKNIQLSAGGYYSLLHKLSVNTYTTNRDTGEFVSESVNTDNHYFSPNFDAGVSFLIGYSFKVSDKNQLMLQAFSNRGLVDLYNGAMGSHRNNTFGLMLSFKR